MNILFAPSTSDRPRPHTVSYVKRDARNCTGLVLLRDKKLCGAALARARVPIIPLSESFWSLKAALADVIRNNIKLIELHRAGPRTGWKNMYN